MKTNIKFLVMTILICLPVFSCQKLDVVGNGSVKSFEKLLAAMGDNVTFDEAAGWLFRAPDNSSLFLWGNFIVLMEFDAKPFFDAGFDITKMPQGISYDGRTFVIGTRLWLETPEFGGLVAETTPLASYKRIVKQKRDMIGYHSAADHFGVSLGGGNMFEWAKDMSANDKDIVFVLNPQPFIDAGVDPDRVEGWLFAKVAVEDEKGRPVEVDKFLKPFDIH